MLIFNSPSELLNILDNLSEQIYYDKIEYVKENYELAKKYVSMDDTFATNLVNLLGEELETE